MTCGALVVRAKTRAPPRTARSLAGLAAPPFFPAAGASSVEPQALQKRQPVPPFVRRWYRTFVSPFTNCLTAVFLFHPAAWSFTENRYHPVHCPGKYCWARFRRCAAAGWGYRWHRIYLICRRQRWQHRFQPRREHFPSTGCSTATHLSSLILTKKAIVLMLNCGKGRTIAKLAPRIPVQKHQLCPPHYTYIHTAQDG